MEHDVLTRWRKQVHLLLEDEEHDGRVRKWTDFALVSAILISVGAGILETVAELRADWGFWFRLVEVIAVVIFTVEYAARIWVAPDDRAHRYMHPIKGRIRYATTPMALIDLAAILPFYWTLAFGTDWIFLRVFRLLRLFKITRYSPALATFEIVLFNERRSLLSAFMIMLVLLTCVSSLLFLAERNAQPEAFGSIPAAMWWGAATLTTVGYGDVVPITPLGKFMGAVTSLAGIAMFALPAAILAAGYTRELRKEEFALTAGLLAKVPAFSHLGPVQLAELTSQLEPRMVPPRYRVMRIGEEADGMYFVVEGEASLHSSAETHRLGPGDFFGAASLLAGTRRRATVTSLTACRLLRLDSGHFHRLMAGDDELRRKVEAAVHIREADWSSAE